MSCSAFLFLALKAKTFHSLVLLLRKIVFQIYSSSHAYKQHSVKAQTLGNIFQRTSYDVKLASKVVTLSSTKGEEITDLKDVV